MQINFLIWNPIDREKKNRLSPTKSLSPPCVGLLALISKKSFYSQGDAVSCLVVAVVWNIIAKMESKKTMRSELGP